MVIESMISMMRFVTGSGQRDLVDQLHTTFTSNILVALAVLVSFKQFGGSPIECLTPDVFSSAWEEYAEMFCFTQDTYHVPMSEVVDGMPNDERLLRRISYYQWVPFFLVFQAAFFRLPAMLWSYVSDHSGLKVGEILRIAMDTANVNPEAKEKNVKALATHIQGSLRFHRRLLKRRARPFKVFCLFNMPYSTSYVTSMYLMMKFLSVMNVFSQLYAMNAFMETSRYMFYGYGAIVDLLQGRHWESSGLFPRSTLCDFEVRVHGNIQMHTIQCVLLINFLNEKIFIFLWFWYLFLLCLTVASFAFWFLTYLFPFSNKQFIVRHLEMSDEPLGAYEHEVMVDRFVRDYLKADGVFVIRTLVFQAGVIYGTEVLKEIWKSYLEIEHEMRLSDALPREIMSLDPEYNTKSLRYRKGREKAAEADWHPNTPLRAVDQPYYRKFDEESPYAERAYPPQYSPIQKAALAAKPNQYDSLQARREQPLANQKLLDEFQQFLEHKEVARGAAAPNDLDKRSTVKKDDLHHQESSESTM